MKTVCIIPARGGSKRILNKNIKDFLGKPIITYPIEVAKKSSIFDSIYIWTDSTEIQDLALQNKISIMGRPDSSDTETLTETILEFIQTYNFYNDDRIDYLCVLLPTAVFINSKELRLVYKWMVKQNCSGDGIISFCKYPYPIERAFYKDEDDFYKMKMYHSKTMFSDLQKMQPSYYDAGQMYFLNVKSFLEQKKIFMDNIYPIIIDAVDINYPEDWKKAEAFYKVMHE